MQDRIMATLSASKERSKEAGVCDDGPSGLDSPHCAAYGARYQQRHRRLPKEPTAPWVP